jgi:hypothetical protein
MQGESDIPEMVLVISKAGKLWPHLNIMEKAKSTKNAAGLINCGMAIRKWKARPGVCI